MVHRASHYRELSVGYLINTIRSPALFPAATPLPAPSVIVAGILFLSVIPSVPASALPHKDTITETGSLSFQSPVMIDNTILMQFTRY